jgi:hypothetical protein
MRGRIMGVVAGAVALSLAVAGAAPAAPERKAAPSLGGLADLLRLDAELRALLSTDHSGNANVCGPRIGKLSALIARTEFERLPLATRRVALAGVLACADTGDQSEPVLALARRLEPLADEPRALAGVNAALLDEAVLQGRHQEAARRLIIIIDNDADRVKTWWAPFLSPVVIGVLGDEQMSRALLGRMVTLDWKDRLSAAAARNGWALLYSDLLLEDGDRAAAERVVAGADEVETLVVLAQDVRYQRLWPRLAADGRLDWRKVAEAELARRQAAASAAPDLMRMSFAVQEDLRRLERYDEAISIGQAMRKRLDDKAAPFEDRDLMAVRVLTELAMALLDTGKVAEAEAVFAQARAEAKRVDVVPVDPILDWADRLNRLGRHADALALLKSIPEDELTDAGKMWRTAEQICALAATDAPAAWRLLPAAMVREPNGPEALQKALLCMDRQEEAAALFVQRLKEPGRRLDALGAARTVRRPPSVPEREAELLRRRDAMIARPEVQKALTAVGRRLDVPLAGALYGWF